MPILRKKKENNVYSTELLSPRIRPQVNLSEDHMRMNPTLKLSISYKFEKIKQYFGRQKEKTRNVKLSPANIHTIRLRTNRMLFSRQIIPIKTLKRVKIKNRFCLLPPQPNTTSISWSCLVTMVSPTFL